MTIKRNERYLAVGYKSWSAYCASGRIDYGTQHADRLIRASELRPKLEPIGSVDWTEGQLRELCKCETDTDAKRVAKKAIALATKSGERIALQSTKEDLLRPIAGEARKAGNAKGGKGKSTARLPATSKVDTRKTCAKSAGVGERTYDAGKLILDY